MDANRRRLFTSSAAVLAAGLHPQSATARPSLDETANETRCLPPAERYARLDAAAGRPVLDVSGLDRPVVIEAVEVLQPADDKYVVRVRARGGATGLAVGNELQMGFLYPILKQRIAPYLLGKDARTWESLLAGVYVHARTTSCRACPSGYLSRPSSSP